MLVCVDVGIDLGEDECVDAFLHASSKVWVWVGVGVDLDLGEDACVDAFLHASSWVQCVDLDLDADGRRSLSLSTPRGFVSPDVRLNILVYRSMWRSRSGPCETVSLAYSPSHFLPPPPSCSGGRCVCGGGGH